MFLITGFRQTTGFFCALNSRCFEMCIFASHFTCRALAGSRISLISSITVKKECSEIFGIAVSVRKVNHDSRGSENLVLKEKKQQKTKETACCLC